MYKDTSNIYFLYQTMSKYIILLAYWKKLVIELLTQTEWALHFEIANLINLNRNRNETQFLRTCVIKISLLIGRANAK